MNRSDRFARFAGREAVSSDLKRKSVLGALMTGAGGAADFVLRLGSTLILARLLVPEYFGLVAMVTAVTRIAERFATLGLSTATVQAPNITPWTVLEPVLDQWWRRRAVRSYAGPRGCVLLIAHFTDVSFGNVVIEPL